MRSLSIRFSNPQILHRAVVIMAVSAWIIVGSSCHRSDRGALEIRDAMRKSDLPQIQALLKSDPSVVSRKDENGWTPLHFAAAEGHKDVAELLIANKADVNARNNHGSTPLHDAAYEGHKDVAELLVANKADVSARNNDGSTPLHNAAYEGHKDIVELLLANKANVDARNRKGDTALQVAAWSGHRDVAELLVDKKADVDIKDIQGNTALHWAADGGHGDVAQLLLTNKADVNAETDKGATPLHWAAYAGHKEVAELLLAYGAKVDARASGGRTPLHYAAYYGHKDVAELLLAHKADINAKTTDGCTPIQVAVDENHLDVGRLLFANNAEISGPPLQCPRSAPHRNVSSFLFAPGRSDWRFNADRLMHYLYSVVPLLILLPLVGLTLSAIIRHLRHKKDPDNVAAEELSLEDSGNRECDEGGNGAPLADGISETETDDDSSTETGGEADLDVVIRTGIRDPLAAGLVKSLFREGGISFFTMDQNAAARQESGNIIGWWNVRVSREKEAEAREIIRYVEGIK